MIPNGGVGSNFDQAFLFAVPLLHGELLPMSLFSRRHLLQSWQAFAFLARPPQAALHRFGRLIQGSIHTEAGNHGHRIFQLTEPKKQLNHGKTTVPNHHQLALGQPPTNLQDHLQSPCAELLVLARLALVIALRRCQHRQKRQSPGASSPRNWRQQHQAQPTQATGFDEMTMTGADRIAIDPFGFDLRSTATFNGMVQTQYHWTAAGKGPEQPSQQNLAGFQTRPAFSVQNPMKRLEVWISIQTDDAQNGSYSALSRSQDRTDQHELSMLPYAFGKQACKARQDCGIFAGQGLHWRPSWPKDAKAYPVFCYCANG